jgi:hypothetical protein
MSRDEIIKMAREAGIFTTDLHCATASIDIVERFAALVAAAERQARQAAQVENEALKARIARADVELQRAVIAEREACAKVCDEQARRSLASADKAQAVRDQKIYNGAAQTAMWNAAAIRARGAA